MKKLIYITALSFIICSCSGQSKKEENKLVDSKKDELSKLRLMLKASQVESSDVQAIADKIYDNLEVFTKQDSYFIRLALMHFIERVEISGYDQLKFCILKNHAVLQMVS